MGFKSCRVPNECLDFTDFNEILDMIFSKKASVNFYMFHGGTNWGFMNGANVLDVFPYYAPDVASYGKSRSIYRYINLGLYTERR